MGKLEKDAIRKIAKEKEAKKQAKLDSIIDKKQANTKELVSESLYGESTGKINDLYVKYKKLQETKAALEDKKANLSTGLVTLFKEKREARYDKKLKKVNTKLEKIEAKINFLKAKEIGKPKVTSDEGTIEYFDEIAGTLTYELAKAKDKAANATFLTRKIKQKIVSMLEARIEKNDKAKSRLETTQKTLHSYNGVDEAIQESMDRKGFNDFEDFKKDSEPAESDDTESKPESKPEKGQESKAPLLLEYKPKAPEIANDAPEKVSAMSAQQQMASSDELAELSQQGSENELNAEDMKNFNLKSLTKLERLTGVNTKILGVLSKIQADAVDEQDTSIKTSSVVNDQGVADVAAAPEKKEKEDSFLSKLLGLLGIAIASIFGKAGLKFLKGIGKLAVKGVLKFLGLIASAGKGVFKFLGMRIWNSIKHLGSIMADIWKPIGTKVSNLIGIAKKGVMKFIQPALDLVKNIGERVSSLVKTAFQKVAAPFIKIFDKAKKLFGLGKDLLASAKDTVKKKITAIADKAKALKDKAVQKVSTLKDRVVSYAKDKYQKGKKLASKAAGAVKKKATKAYKGAKKLAVKVAKGAKKFIMKTVGKKLQKFIGSKGAGLMMKFAKSAGKKIPGIGALVGLGFAIKEAMGGHYKKAALALASGVVASIPVVGLPLSIALDVVGDNYIDEQEAKDALGKDGKDGSKTSENKPGDESKKLKMSEIRAAKLKQISNATVIGTGDTTDYITVKDDKGKEHLIKYNYNENQKYKWSEDEIKEKYKSMTDGKEVSYGVESIPKDKNHINPSAIMPSKESSGVEQPDSIGTNSSIDRTNDTEIETESAKPEKNVESAKETKEQNDDNTRRQMLHNDSYTPISTLQPAPVINMTNAVPEAKASMSVFDLYRSDYK